MEGAWWAIAHGVTKSWTRLIGYWNTKVGSQEISGVTGKFGLRVQNEARQRLIEFAKRMLWS